MEHAFLRSHLWKQLTSCLIRIERIAEDSGSDVDHIAVPYTAMAVSGRLEQHHLRALGTARKAVFLRETQSS